MGRKNSIKSFSELQYVISQKEEKEKEEKIYLEKKAVLIDRISKRIHIIENANNGILRKTFKYNGKSKIANECSDEDKITVFIFLKNVKVYTNSERPSIDELKRIYSILVKIVESSTKLDKRRREKELERLEKEKIIKEKRDAELKKLEEFCKKRKATRPLENAIKKRKIETLFHFTRIENLASIIEKGICSREELFRSQRNFVYNDEWRMDGLLNCSCLTIEFPNTWLLKKLMEQTPDSSWVLLLLNVVFCKFKFPKIAGKNGEFCISILEKIAGRSAGLSDAA